RFSADRPWITHVDNHLVAQHIQIRVLQDVDFRDSSLVVQVLRTLVKVYAIADPQIAAVPGVHTETERSHVVGWSLEDRGRGSEWVTAFPELHDARIARRRHAARPKIGPDEQRAVIDPGSVGFCLGNLESIADE